MVRLLGLLHLLHVVLACGQNNGEQRSNSTFLKTEIRTDPPACDCCVFDEAKTIERHQTKIASDTATGTRMIIKGTVYESDGKTPASNVLMYFYQTDNRGYYSKRGDEDRNSFAWWHGYTRAFLKTNDKGEYEINTIRPAPYPARIEPAHIHCVVKSPRQKRCYSIADFVFSDDELLTPKYWRATSRLWKSFGIDGDPNYGGIQLTRTTFNLLEGKRDIILLDEYDFGSIESGKPIGSESPAFSPQHVAGHDKGTHACPMCKYGYHPGVMFFLNTDDDWENVSAICKRLEEESKKRRSQRFKAYLVYTNPKHVGVEELEMKLKKFADSLAIQDMAITYVPSIADKKTEMHLNNINPNTKNTIVVYNNRRVFDKFIDFTPTERNFSLLFNSLDEAESEIDMKLK